MEPGNGWYYTGIVKGFQAGVGNDPLALAKVMCDSYMEGCEAAGTADQATLSVTDLRKLPQLRDAYENMGVEAMAAASQAPKPFFSRYAREAEQTTNFGGNTRDTGFTNMIDMGDFAKRTADLLPDTASKVQQALANAVLYDAASNSYRILGAREGLNEEGAADRNLVKLKPGDTVTTQQYMMHDGKAGYEGRMADIDTFQLSENFQIRDTKLKDGTYAYVFDFITPTDDTAMSAMAFYEIKQGEVTTYVAKQ